MKITKRELKETIKECLSEMKLNEAVNPNKKLEKDLTLAIEKIIKSIPKEMWDEKRYKNKSMYKQAVESAIQNIISFISGLNYQI